MRVVLSVRSNQGREERKEGFIDHRELKGGSPQVSLSV